MTPPGRVLGAPSPEGETPAGLLHRALAVQAGRAVQPMRGKPADPRPATPVPPGLGTLVPASHQEGDHGGLPRPPRHAQCRTQSANTPRTRHLPPERTSAPAGREHRGAAEHLNRPSGLLGPRARKRARAVLRGPRCSNAPGLPGRRTSPPSRFVSGRRVDLSGRTADVHAGSAVSPSSQPVPPRLVHRSVHKSDY